MLFWTLGILNMLALYFVGGPISAIVGMCYTIIIRMAASIIVKRGHVASK